MSAVYLLDHNKYLFYAGGYHLFHIDQHGRLRHPVVINDWEQLWFDALGGRKEAWVESCRLKHDSFCPILTAGTVTGSQHDTTSDSAASSYDQWQGHHLREVFVQYRYHLFQRCAVLTTAFCRQLGSRAARYLAQELGCSISTRPHALASQDVLGERLMS